MEVIFGKNGLLTDLINKLCMTKAFICCSKWTVADLMLYCERAYIFARLNNLELVQHTSFRNWFEKMKQFPALSEIDKELETGIIEKYNFPSHY